MQANPRSLDQLFNSQIRYVVPMFQRLYVWQEVPQWQTLWEDVVEKANIRLAGSKTNAHYLGALIIEGVTPSSPREVKRFLVIDGQQRLTTLQLLLCAFRDLARKNQWKTLDRAATRYLENVDPDVMEHPDEELFKLWPTALNRDVFRSIIAAGGKATVETKYPLVRLRRKRKPEPRSNLVEAYLYFSRCIDAWISKVSAEMTKAPEDCAFVLLHALQQDFSVVEIIISEGDDSQEIFYSLNSQGRPLSQSDLLRSLIFMRAEKEKLDRDAIFNDYWNKFETDFWSWEVPRGGRNYSRLDLGLRFFLMAKRGELVDARRVNEEYRRWINDPPPKYASVRDELKDFTRYAEAYKAYESADALTLPSNNLRRILLDFDVSTALPLVLYLELEEGLSDSERTECLFLVESFLARRLFTGEENKEYNKFFVEVIGTIRNRADGTAKTALTSRLLAGVGTTRLWPTDAQLVENAISRPLSQLRTPALRLILERLELALRTKKTEAPDVPNALQIEHVMPQSWSANWPLSGKKIPWEVASSPFYAKDDLAPLADAIRRRNSLVQTLGNLTLVNGYLNPAAGNAAFDVKLGEYKNSVLRLNRYFDSRQEWDEKDIQERGRLLGELFCKIWPRPAGLTT